MGKKILLVEDENVVINILKKKFVEEGYDISMARNGIEGLEKMREIKPDLILLDIVMPKMNGFEVMEEMQKDSELKKIPVIVISNSGQPVELDKAIKLGAKDWFIKTEFDPREIIDKVLKLIEK